MRIRTDSRSSEPTLPTLSATHDAVGAWFLGPKAENHKYLQKNFEIIVKQIQDGRQAYFPDDEKFIDDAMTSSVAFQENMKKLEENLAMISTLLGKHSVPFFSPRYIAHMVSDVSMPAVLGYLTAMLYNQNNVTPEASPLTSYIEYLVGQQLCGMLGYTTKNQVNKNANLKDQPVGWGHLTAGGSIANLESMWVARNLKFYPLSLKNAMANQAPLAFVAPSFKVQLCTGATKLYSECSHWELLNLTAEVIVRLPARLSLEYGMSTTYIEHILEEYIIQTVGKDQLIMEFGTKQPHHLVSTTKHYSWPKGAAITGIGRNNLIEVRVDDSVRMDTQHLEILLQEHLDKEQAVYAVVAIMGTTEHGAVDPLAKIVEIRDVFRKKGLSFLVHADCAWGGYFASLLVEKPASQRGTNPDPGNKYVPALTLSPYTETQLAHLKYADTITIDPHKSGYIPYPAGGLCYRDDRLRYQVTWKSPYVYVSESGVEAMGVHGVEGSKPGASAVAAWLSHEVIGLHKGGYGVLLGETIFTALKMYSHWATMSYDSSILTVTTLNMLPAERSGRPPDEIEAQRRFIHEKIVNRPNLELVEDEEAMKLVKDMGSDLMVNAFACNFRIDGVLNKDIAEANYLNKRLYERLSITKVTDDIQERPLILMSTVLEQNKLGKCLSNFKKRIGLEGDEDLYALSNLCMSPFPTAGSFMGMLADTFRKIAEEEIQNCYRRVRVTPSHHGFIIQGSNPIHLVYLPMFNLGNHRRQVIITAKLPEYIIKLYVAKQKENPSQIFTLHTVEPALLSEILAPGKSFKAVIDAGLPIAYGVGHLLPEFEVSDVTVLINRSIGPKHVDKAYPNNMPFYFYGTPEEAHIDHMLLCAPNVQLSASQVKVDIRLEAEQLAVGLSKGLILTLDAWRENIMAPFTANHKPTFFKSGRTLDVTVYHDHNDSISNGPDLLQNLGEPFAKGTITIGDGVWVDYDFINQDHVWKDEDDALKLATKWILGAAQGKKSDNSELQKKMVGLDAEMKKQHYAVTVRKELLVKLGAIYPSKDPSNHRNQALSEAEPEQPPASELPVENATASRYFVHEPSLHGDKMGVRQGWKDTIDSMLEQRVY